VLDSDLVKLLHNFSLVVMLGGFTGMVLHLHIDL